MADLCKTSSERRPHFFKVLLGRFAEELRIPPAFVKHLNGESSGHVSLKGPSGNVWHAELRKNVCDVYLQNSWQGFVKDHSLKQGDFLVFRYDGSLHFTVQIFDKSACEKEDAFCVKVCKETTSYGEFQEKARENPSAAPKTTPKKKCKMQSQPLQRRSPRKSTSETTYHEDVQEKPRENPWAACKTTPEKKHKMHIQPLRRQSSPKTSEKKRKMHSQPLQQQFSHKTTSKKKRKMHSQPLQRQSSRKTFSEKMHKMHSQPLQQQSPCLNPVVSGTRLKSSFSSDPSPKNPATNKRVRKRSGIYKSQRRAVTQEEKERTLKTAKSFKSSNPFAIVVMRKNYVYTGACVFFPAGFSRDHLPRAHGKMFLQDPSGKKWVVHYLYYTSSGGLGAGWPAFSFGNNLEEDDVCAFELIEEKVLKVHIFRVVENLTRLIKNNRKSNPVAGFGRLK